MKKLLVLIVLVSSIKIFSQEVVIPSKQENVNTDENIYEKVDRQPEYPGGINAFRSNFSKTFNASRIIATGIIKSEAQFVISKEGIITDIKISGDNKSMNQEMERTIKAMSKTRWKPAEIKGYPVKYNFKLPITMNL